jgi:hypothetical protein
MDPLGIMRAFGDFRRLGRRAFFEGEQKCFAHSEEATVGDNSALASLQFHASCFETAQRAFTTSLGAMKVSATLLRRLPSAGRSLIDHSEFRLPGDHVGVSVGRNAQALLGSGIANWLAERDRAADAS